MHQISSNYGQNNRNGAKEFPETGSVGFPTNLYKTYTYATLTRMVSTSTQIHRNSRVERVRKAAANLVPPPGCENVNKYGKDWADTCHHYTRDEKSAEAT